jgi:hypothetical protein
MKNFIAVIASDAGKITKYQDFNLEAEALAHVAEFGGFVAPSPGHQTKYWIVGNNTLTWDSTLEASDLAKVPLINWAASMQETDASMPRWFEDYVTENSVALAPGKSKESYDAKVKRRSEKP